MQEIEMPNGEILEFPDGMDDAAIQSALSNYKPQSMSFGDAVNSATQFDTLKSSGSKLLSDMAYPIMHPVQTYEGVKTLAKGAVNKFTDGVQPEEASVDALGNMIHDRYGTWDNTKRTLATDPFGLAGDASMLLSGGGAAAARLPGMLGKAGKAASTVGNVIDPIGGTLKAAGTVASPLIGVTTGAGGASIRQAAKAGGAGGEQASAFLDNMRRGSEVAGDSVIEATQAVKAMSQEMRRGYLDNKKNWATANKPIDWQPINAALDSIGDVRTFRGVSGTAKVQSLDDAAAAARQKVLDTVNEWQQLDPAEFHTVVGIDALKQKIGKMLDNTPYDQKSTRAVYGEVYQSLKKEIMKQSPTYGAAMKQYENSMDIIRDVEQTLSLNPRASVDTKLRKLQSIMRNNANTNYGRRLELGKLLEQAGAKTLMSKLAGQSLNSWTARGIQGAIQGGQAAVPLGMGAGLSHFLDPSALGGIALQSPRLMGEASYYAGKLHRPLGYGSHQAGRFMQGK
jgi:hypothetical protein